MKVTTFEEISAAIATQVKSIEIDIANFAKEQISSLNELLAGASCRMELLSTPACGFGAKEILYLNQLDSDHISSITIQSDFPADLHDAAKGLYENFDKFITVITQRPGNIACNTWLAKTAPGIASVLTTGSLTATPKTPLIGDGAPAAVQTALALADPSPVHDLATPTDYIPLNTP